MKNIEWMKLKSGTDIRGTALDIDGSKINLTAETAEILGICFAYWLSKKIDFKEGLTVAVGNDSRLSGEKLKNSLIKGLTAFGVDVFDCGLSSTPAMFMSTIIKGHGYDGAVMITASHLPRDKNGFKFFTEKGGLESENIMEILNFAENKQYESVNISREGKVQKVDLIKNYAEHIKNKIRDGVSVENKDKVLKDFHIIVDAGNGSGGFFVKYILEPLGVDTTGSLYLEPDGNFPNHIPNPEDKNAMQSIKEAVLKHDADLGIIFDTDVDRAAVVDSEGKAVNRNRLLALAAAVVIEEFPGAAIVTDSVTSAGLNNFIEEKLGGVHHRYKRGYKNVINEAKRLNDEGQETPLAIETSGHAAFKENYFLDDGAYLVAKILIKMANLKLNEGRKIKDVIADLEEAQFTEEYRIQIKLSEFKDYGNNILKRLEEYTDEREDWQLAVPNYQGVRVNCGKNDWFLLRMSLHDPVLVLNVECDSEEKLSDILESLENFLSQFKKIELKGVF